MDDEKIVELFWERSETAILETQNKYGNYCHRIAYNILHSDYDAEECVNDTYAKAWNAIPPARPNRLSTFLGKLTRNIALNRYAHDHAQKRNTHMDLVLSEVEEFLPATEGLPLSDEITLRDAINEFVAGLAKRTRMVFVRRYWYLDSIRDIARDLGMTESGVKVTLLRTRNKFRVHLERKGIIL